MGSVSSRRPGNALGLTWDLCKSAKVTRLRFAYLGYASWGMTHPRTFRTVAVGVLINNPALLRRVWGLNQSFRDPPDISVSVPDPTLAVTVRHVVDFHLQHRAS